MNDLFRAKQEETKTTIGLNGIWRGIDGESPGRGAAAEAGLRRQGEQLPANAVALMCPMDKKHGHVLALPQMQHTDDLLAVARNQGYMVCAIAFS
jgi:hypothetical protein